MSEIGEDVVVYRAYPSNVAEVLDLLGREGLDAHALDSPSPTMRHASKGTYSIRVAVPALQAQQAAAILTQWESRSEVSTRTLAGRFRRQALWALAVAAVSIPIFRLCADCWTDIRWELVPVVWLVALVVVANAGRLPIRRQG